MRKTGRPLGSGYDDTAAIRKIFSLMQEEGATRRSAIIRVCGHDQLRRLEMKMAARGVARNEGSTKMTTRSVWGVGHRIGVDEGGTTVVLAPRELQGSVLALGRDGVDRTSFLLCLARSMIAGGSGLIFIDMTGDASLPARIAEIASALGRDEDLQIVDFNTSAGGSRSFNPFESADSDALIHTCVELLDYEGTDGAIWKGRAASMLSAVLTALVWLRDEKGLTLDADVVRKALDLDAIIALATDARLPSHIRGMLGRYLATIPGFTSRKPVQAVATREQHGYLQMQFSIVLRDLVDLDAGILKLGCQSVALDEIALRRRILLVSLPAPMGLRDRDAHVARFVGASLMAMVRTLAGKPAIPDDGASMARSTDPVFPIVLNGVGEFMTAGMEKLAGVARSHGFCLVLADRSFEDVAEREPRLAESVVASCRTRIGFGSSGEIDLVQGDRSRRLTPVQADA